MIQWIAEHKLTRHIQIRQSGRISAPLTYGVFKPIVLMPKGTTCDDINQIEYILAHEFVHIRRFDTAKKILLTAALCVHWFNPLVWVMYILSNRDIELSCDEAVVRSFGNIKKSDYALTLISMEEKKSNLSPLCNNFSKSAIEERITAIMKIKKTSAISILIAVSLIIGVTTVFATSSNAFNTSFDVTPSAISDKSSSTTSISQSDYNKLFALRFDGYDKMTVEKYREKVKTIIDTPEYTELLKRLEEDAKFYGMRYTNDMSSFFFGTLMPLMDKEWQTQNFEGTLQFSDDNVQGENDVLKYQLSLTISDASRVTVGEYEHLWEGIIDGLSDYLNTKTSAELQDRDVMYREIFDELSELSRELSNIALGEISVAFELDDSLCMLKMDKYGLGKATFKKV